MNTDKEKKPEAKTELELLREKAIKETKEAISKSITEDNKIIQATSSLDILENSANAIAKKAREWYSLNLPELEHQIKDHEKFLEIASNKNKEELMKELKINITMGTNLEKIDLETLKSFLELAKKMQEERRKIKKYLSEISSNYCPGLQKMAGTTITAKLITQAGSLNKLSRVPASTLQLYGAETALFRHLKNKKRNRPPKYGFIFSHPLIQKVSRENRGKASRALADKLSIITKIDYFNKDKNNNLLKAEEMIKELENKFDIKLSENIENFEVEE